MTVGQGPSGAATGDGSVWVANTQGGSLSRVDPLTLAVSPLDDVGDDPLA